MTRMVRITYTRGDTNTPWAHEAIGSSGNAAAIASYNSLLAATDPSTGTLASGTRLKVEEKSSSELYSYALFPDLPETDPADLRVWVLHRQRALLAEVAESSETVTNAVDNSTMTVNHHAGLEWVITYRNSNNIKPTAFDIVDHTF